MPLKECQFISILEKEGWHNVRTTGEHRIFSKSGRSYDDRFRPIGRRRKAWHIPGCLAANRFKGREMIKRKHSLAVDGDESGYSAYIPDLQTIVVTGAIHAGTDRPCQRSGSVVLG